MTGAQRIVEVLRVEGVDTVFAYPGGSVIALFDALAQAEDIALILVRHEQAACHAADGYARAGGRVGVCLVTSGPGATNTITSLMTAKSDSVPLVVLSGQVRTDILGRDAFQEADVLGLTHHVCKHSYQVRRPEDLVSTLHQAFRVARSGRPGPVSIDLPVDVLLSAAPDVPEAKSAGGPDSHCFPPRANPLILSQIASALAGSKKPLVLAGGGVIAAEASPELMQFLAKTAIPAVTTLMGLGIVPWDHPLFLGMPGMHGHQAANLALSACDLLLGVGVRFDDRVTGDLQTFAPQASIVHIDIDASEINKNVRASIALVADAKTALQELIPLTPARPPDDWNKEVNGWRDAYPLSYDQESSREILPQYVIDTLNQSLDQEAIVVTDVGQHQMWAAQYIRSSRPRSFLTSGGLGTMGFGLPAALGASLARPGRTVVVITGDGSIQMNIQELATCTAQAIPLKIIVLNNSFLGMVRQWQELFWNKNYVKTCLRQSPACPKDCRGPGPQCPDDYRPDLLQLAAAYGLPAARAAKPADVAAVLRQGFQTPGPVLMEFLVKKTENVFPMQPPLRNHNPSAAGTRVLSKTLLVKAVNQPDLLARLTGHLTAKGFLIESLSGAPDEDRLFFDLHLTVTATEDRAERAAAVLQSLIPVVKVVDVAGQKDSFFREFVMVKVNALKNRPSLFELIELFRARVVDVDFAAVTVDCSGSVEKIRNFINRLRPYGIQEVVRTGQVSLGGN